MSINTSFTDDHNHTSVRGYLMVFAALMFLTVLTVLMSLIDFGLLMNAAVAVAIAAVKTSLVVYFFMHVRESPRLIAFIVLVSFAFLGVLIVFTVTDFRAQRGDGASSLPHAQPW